VNVTRIPLTKPVFGAEELRAVQRPLESGWVVQGPYVKEFERRFASFTGAPFAVAASSCTTALHLALAALGAGPGNEVIVPAFTWIATANAVEYAGATPVFCDIDLQTFNASADAIEACITSRTVGIIPVHLFGLCAEIEAILALARRRSLWVVVDAACGFGARVNRRHAGTFGDAGCFSFHPRKAITTGEGGMVVTARADLARLVTSLRDHGAQKSDTPDPDDPSGVCLPEFPHLGFNYRMTDIQGALGCAQMDRAEGVVLARRHRAAQYDAMLADIEWLAAPTTPDGYIHGYQAYVCLFRPESPNAANLARLHHRRNELMADLAAQGIATRQGTHAPVLASYYVQKYDLTAGAFPNAVTADRLSLAIPLYPQMTDAEQAQVVDGLRDAFHVSSRQSASRIELG
jgi:perosamine synthetase